MWETRSLYVKRSFDKGVNAKTSTGIGYSKYRLVKRESGRSSRPRDVLDIFGAERRYSGTATKPLRRRYEVFLSTCEVWGVKTTSPKVMFPLTLAVFLKCLALVYFIDFAIHNVKITKRVLQLSETNSSD